MKKARIDVRKRLFLVGIAVCMISLTSCYSKNNDKFEKSIDNANKATYSSSSDEITTETITDANGETYEEKSDRLINVTKETFQKRISDKESFWIYVGRPNCPDCQKYYPNLVEYLENQNLTIGYFNTRVKTSKKAEMIEMLEKLGVDEVPAIIEFNKGNVIRVYDMQKKQDITNFEDKYKGKL